MSVHLEESEHPKIILVATADCKRNRGWPFRSAKYIVLENLITTIPGLDKGGNAHEWIYHERRKVNRINYSRKLIKEAKATLHLNIVIVIKSESKRK